jgi:uncharacterized protein YcbK (DUF882 family)
MTRGPAIATALLLLMAAGPSYADEDEGAGEAETGAPAPSAGAEAGDGEAPAARPSKRRRRGKARHSYKYTGRVVPEEALRVDPLPRPSGKIHVVSLNNPNEQAQVNIYNSDGSYNLDAMGEVNFVLRCRRTDVEKDMDPQLLTLLSHVYDHFGKPLEIVSAYRNQRKLTSNHTKGTASDIRIAGVSPKVVRAFAETLDRGGMGIGIYPRSQFVHIDVRPPPSYRWVDYSPPNSNASEKRPPRGWKRKKLES